MGLRRVDNELAFSLSVDVVARRWTLRRCFVLHFRLGPKSCSAVSSGKNQEVLQTANMLNVTGTPYKH